MKKADWQIMAHLRKEGRISLTELSKRVRIPVSTLHDRLRNTVSANLCKPSLLLNFDELGFPARAYILLKVNKHQKQNLLEKLERSTTVNTLLCVNNGWDLIMECVFADMRALERFVEDVESKFDILNKEVHYVLSEIKRESFLSDPTTLEITLAESNI